MPALTRWTYGAINPLTIEHYTLREISEYLTQYREYRREVEEANRGR